MSISDPLQEFYDSVDMSIFDKTPNPLSKRRIEDKEWVEGNRKQLRQYQGKWIAVYQKKVLAAGDDVEMLEQQATQLLGKEVQDLHLHFLESGMVIY